MTLQDLISAMNASRAERSEEPLLLQRVKTDYYRAVPASIARNSRRLPKSKEPKK